MRSFFRAFLAGAVVACWVNGAWAGEERHVQLAARLCAGLVAHMSGEPAQPFVFRSYEPPADASPLHPALENAGFTYDNALAVMALYACGRKSEAGRVADALVLALKTDRFYHDGRLRNAYRAGPVEDNGSMLLPGYWSPVSKSWIEDDYQVGSATGSTAWGALALLTAYEQTGRRPYLDAARTIMDWIHRSTADPQNPGYFGGFFGQEPSPERIGWKSTEHNLDVYAADRWLAGLDPMGDWMHHAEKARAFLEAMWDFEDGRFFVGSLPDSAVPNTRMSGLDAELWPLIAVPAYAFRRARVLEWTKRNHGVDGGFDFNNDRDGTWLEGTAQAALVFRLSGRGKEAEPLFETISRQVAPDGLLYATVNAELSTGLKVGPDSTSVDFKYFRLPHIGATAWAVLAALKRNPFIGTAGQSASR
ncbi:methylaspartate ammonia-lyase [Rhizobium sp. ERR 922]|uniref:hypothetical protein n=1 Tax=Rhizobium TaxID=379 RepID=UPI000DE09F10|nr:MULTISPECIES: hypothetical protein [Rhizobium]MCZ3374596.1 hypothetical protein [Rhizobium sp. AG207R]TWB49246.1 methylaspartate ammonia-lyase [Rhizobium sp. ERR 922]TWB91777.1 methylaspartate ammonia-lyase [Rhizobium sp. ERR 942]GES41558.1 hypothetical protein RsS62_08100 [Rhizobium dioscoreae]